MFKLNAQIDGPKKPKNFKGFVYPEDSLETKALIPDKSLENPKNINAPKVIGNLNLPKKEFSMFPEEEFANPGELYTKKLDKIEKELLPEGHGENAGLKKDTYWGDYITTSKYVNIMVRDYSAIDGDVLHILVNDDIVQPNVYLTQGYRGFKLDLVEGVNKIDFIAISTGSSGPNTAEYKIVDDKIKLISRKVWALSKGVKVTFIVIKE